MSTVTILRCDVCMATSKNLDGKELVPVYTMRTGIAHKGSPNVYVWDGDLCESCIKDVESAIKAAITQRVP